MDPFRPQPQRADSLWSIAHFRSLAVIACLGAAAHGLIVATDYILWDGWSYSHFLTQPGQLVHLQRLFHEIGRPLDMLFWLPFVGGENLHISAKIAGVAAWILSGCMMYLVLVKSRIASAPPALMCAAVAVTLPVFDVLGELSIWMNTACFALFWLGWLLVLCLPPTGVWRLVVRLLALAVFYLAFNLNSQLVFYCAFAACVLLLPRLGESRRSILAAIPRALMRYPDFAALPFAFWILKRHLTPSIGYYEGYNVPSLSPEVLGRGGASLVQGFLGGEVAGLFESPSWLVLALATVGLAALWVDRRNVRWPEPVSATDGAHIFLGGVFLLLAGAFPYAVVDQSFQSFGWLTRNSILLGLPLAMMTVGGVSFLGARLAPARPGFAWWVIALVVMLGIGSANRMTLRWQAFGAKQDSIAAQLHPVVRQTAPALVQLRDYFLVPRTIDFYAPIVWTYILSRGQEAPRTFAMETAQIAPDQLVLDSEGRQQRQITLLAFDEPTLRAAIEQTTMPYAMRDIPHHGTQLVAVVEAGEFGTDAVRIGWEYMRRRLFDRSAIPDLLNRLTTVQTQELAPIPPESSGEASMGQ